jgi:hypothetical protein
MLLVNRFKNRDYSYLSLRLHAIFYFVWICEICTGDNSEIHIMEFAIASLNPEYIQTISIQADLHYTTFT